MVQAFKARKLETSLPTNQVATMDLPLYITYLIKLLEKKFKVLKTYFRPNNIIRQQLFFQEI